MELLESRQLAYAPEPRTFSGLMDLYEQNYIRLRRLIPDFDRLGEKAVSTVRGCMDLHYHCLERSRYTTVFVLTHRFETPDGKKVEPDLKIRVYHDARMAEVLDGTLRCFYGADAEPAKSGLFCTDLNILQPKWRLNRFLFKWLNFCLLRGHLLAPQHVWPYVQSTPAIEPFSLVRQ
jgi:uncharacterized protein YqiB (DUF1249 family)